MPAGPPAGMTVIPVIQSPAMSSPESITIIYDDGYTAHARYWSPGGQVQEAILYLHGIQSHGGWFERSAETLATAGFHVLLPDRRGSGRNQLDRGHARSAGRLLKDVAEGIEWLKRKALTEKVNLVGVSWGGKLALATAMRQPQVVHNLILVAPGLFPQMDLPWQQKVAVAACALVRPQRPFPIPLNEPELFTDNPRMQKFIGDDPLRLRTATARFLAASRMLDMYVRRTAPRHTWPFAVTFLLAGRERIIDNDQTRHFAQTLRCRDRRIIDFANAAHTLEFEPDSSEYLAELAGAVM